MKLCVFQGTFNPIHNAHLKMAEYILQNYGFDKILFIPAYKPPHKDYNLKMSEHRFKMVQLAVSSNPKFEVSDIEYKNDRISYTYLTIQELYKKYDIEDKINFIIGTDAFEKIDSWYETDKLKDLVAFIIFVRQNELDKNRFKYLKGYHYKFAQMDFEDISSTQIRDNIKTGKSIKNLVPEQVERYIRENELYKY